MGTCSSTRRRHGFLMLAVLVILSLGATAALAGAPAAVLYQSELQPPPNDNFANAALINTLSYTDAVDTGAATTEVGEPMNCDTMGWTVWYTLTPTTTALYRVNTQGSFVSQTYVSIWQGTALDSLAPGPCTTYGYYDLPFTVQAGQTYYIQLGTPARASAGSLTLNVAMEPPPQNDNFADALIIRELPYNGDIIDMSSATMELPDEKAPSCAQAATRTMWYSYTPEPGGLVTGYVSGWGFSPVVAVYTGPALDQLNEVYCRGWYERLNMNLQAGTTYYFQLANSYPSDYGGANLSLIETPPVSAYFEFYPWDPAKQDNVTFTDGSYDPAGAGFVDYSWYFGDGASASGYSVSHQFAADGEYSVLHKVAVEDGRTAEVTRVVTVRTHDVAITKFSVPQSASAGQTRQIVVGLRNYAYPENVRVELYKSVVNGEAQVGWLLQQVAVRSGNRTTDFNFSYTFTSDDAKLGKVTFRAVATIDNARDALPADNTAISSPVKVGGKK